jgi:hypothetical protein
LRRTGAGYLLDNRLKTKVDASGLGWQGEKLMPPRSDDGLRKLNLGAHHCDQTAVSHPLGKKDVTVRDFAGVEADYPKNAVKPRPSGLGI